jgi:esterase/lipase superfamily enzyme
MTAVFFATNRHQSGSPGQDVFGGDPPADQASRLWLGVAEVSTGGGPAQARQVRQVACTGRDDFAPGGSCGDLLDRFLAAAGDAEAVPLLYIHGFQYSFEEALARTGELVEWYEATGAVRLVPLLFTWPSRGSLSAEAYRQDSGSARAAGPALGRLLQELASRSRAPRRFCILAHSMGAHALRHGLQAALAGWGGSVPRFVRTAILAAGDTDADVLERGRDLAPLAEMAEQVIATVYAQDKISGWIGAGKGNALSLATDGPPLNGALSANVFALDVAFVTDITLPAPGDQVVPNWIAHQYYRNQPAIADDLAMLLDGRRAPLPNWERYWPATFRPGGVRQAPFYYYALS